MNPVRPLQPGKQVTTEASGCPEHYTNHGTGLVARLGCRPDTSDEHAACSLNDQLEEDLEHDATDYTKESAERFFYTFPNWHDSSESV